mmetsp:Transcript_4303/g.12627  ORF Transcript_4303/g.12627 Transcript_4303/m.12627 type:complete len:292 (-) Transcript_4303:802-1677(-)
MFSRLNRWQARTERGCPPVTSSSLKASKSQSSTVSRTSKTGLDWSIPLGMTPSSLAGSRPPSLPPSSSVSKSMVEFRDKDFFALLFSLALRGWARTSFRPFGLSISNRLRPTSPSNPFLLDRSISSKRFGALKFWVRRACFSLWMSSFPGCLPAMMLSNRAMVLSTVLSRSRDPFAPCPLALFSSTWSCLFLVSRSSRLSLSSSSSFLVSCMLVWFTRMACSWVMGSLAAHISNSTHRCLLGSRRLGIFIWIRKDSNFSTKRTCWMCSRSFSAFFSLACTLGSRAGPLLSG